MNEPIVAVCWRSCCCWYFNGFIDINQLAPKLAQFIPANSGCRFAVKQTNECRWWWWWAAKTKENWNLSINLSNFSKCRSLPLSWTKVILMVKLQRTPKRKWNGRWAVNIPNSIAWVLVNLLCFQIYLLAFVLFPLGKSNGTRASDSRIEWHTSYVSYEIQANYFG